MTRTKQRNDAGSATSRAVRERELAAATAAADSTAISIAAGSMILGALLAPSADAQGRHLPHAQSNADAADRLPEHSTDLTPPPLHSTEMASTQDHQMGPAQPPAAQPHAAEQSFPTGINAPSLDHDAQTSTHDHADGSAPSDAFGSASEAVPDPVSSVLAQSLGTSATDSPAIQSLSHGIPTQVALDAANNVGALAAEVTSNAASALSHVSDQIDQAVQTTTAGVSDVLHQATSTIADVPHQISAALPPPSSITSTVLGATHAVADQNVVTETLGTTIAPEVHPSAASFDLPQPVHIGFIGESLSQTAMPHDLGVHHGIGSILHGFV